jgi:putative membrane protein
MKIGVSLLLSAAFLAAPLAAKAQTASPPNAQTFVQDAEGGNQYEIQAAKLAEKQGSGRAVKTFARDMVRDHTKLGRQMSAALRRDKSASLPKSSPIPSNLQQNLDTLKSEKGAQFDRDYVQQMVQSHQQTLSEFQSYAQNGDDPVIKAVAKKATPVIRHHLTMAQRLPGASS